MEDNTRTSEPVTDEAISLLLDDDDVEAHGLKEIAVGLTAAAAIGGGAAAIASHAAQVTVKPPSATQQAVNDASRFANTTAGSAAAFAGTVADDARTLTADTMGVAKGVADPAIDLANSIVSSTLNTAGTIVSGTEAKAGRVVSHSVGNASSAVNDGVRLATNAESKAVGTADSTITGAQSTVKSTVHSTTATAIQVVGYARSVVGGWTLDVKVLNHDVKAGGNMLDPSGNVSITDSQGHVLATAKLANGACTLHLRGAGADASYTLHYGGDDDFTASSLGYIVPSI